MRKGIRRKHRRRSYLVKCSKNDKAPCPACKSCGKRIKKRRSRKVKIINRNKLKIA